MNLITPLFNSYKSNDYEEVEKIAKNQISNSNATAGTAQMMKVKLQHLRFFVAVYEERSITAAKECREDRLMRGTITAFISNDPIDW